MDSIARTEQIEHMFDKNSCEADRGDTFLFIVVAEIVGSLELPCIFHISLADFAIPKVYQFFYLLAYICYSRILNTPYINFIYFFYYTNATVVYTYYSKLYVFDSDNRTNMVIYWNENFH